MKTSKKSSYVPAIRRSPFHVPISSITFLSLTLQDHVPLASSWKPMVQCGLKWLRHHVERDLTAIEYLITSKYEHEAHFQQCSSSQRDERRHLYIYIHYCANSFFLFSKNKIKWPTVQFPTAVNLNIFFTLMSTAFNSLVFLLLHSILIVYK